MALGKLGTISGSTTGSLSGLLEITNSGDSSVEYIEDLPTLANASGLVTGQPGDKREGEITFTMKFDTTHKAQRTALMTAKDAAAASSTTETWTLTPPTGSTEVVVGYVSRVGGITLSRGGHMQYECAIQPTGAKAFSA